MVRKVVHLWDISGTLMKYFMYTFEISKFTLWRYISGTYLRYYRYTCKIYKDLNPRKENVMMYFMATKKEKKHKKVENLPNVIGHSFS